MIEDNNGDLIFKYTVPDAVYKVPARGVQAAELTKIPQRFGEDLEEFEVKDEYPEGATFLDCLKCAFDVRLELEAYAESVRQAEAAVNRPAPLGGYDGGGYDAFRDSKNIYQSGSYHQFAKAFAEAEERLQHVGRSYSAPNDDRALWVPLKFN